jgi:hypothetical protein
MKNLIVLTLLLLGLFVSSCRKTPDQFAASDKYRLVWTDDPTSTITIAWDQLEASEAIVYYGTEDYGRRFWKYKGRQTPHRKLQHYEMNTHFAKLSGLLADQSYYFVIQDDKGVSERYWFKTAPDLPEPFTFITGGDTKSGDDPLKAGRSSNKATAKLRPLFVLYNGDFTSGNGTDPFNWKQWLTDWHAQTTTSDGRMIPIMPVHGNHENGDHANLNYIFDAPYQDNDSSRIYYSLSFGGDLFHTIALNTEIDEGGAQRDWLAKDLEESEYFQFKVAGFHKPFYPHTTRKRENSYQYKQWAFLFDKYGLDIGVDADSHMHKVTFPVRPDTVSSESHMGFVRDDENGTMYLGEGSWGAHPRPNDDDKPWTMASGSFNQLKWIHVHPANGQEKATMKIYTVITASYDENEKLTLYNDDVPALTEDNLFEVPEGLNLFVNPDGSIYVSYPYTEN